MNGPSKKDLEIPHDSHLVMSVNIYLSLASCSVRLLTCV